MTNSEYRKNNIKKFLSILTAVGVIGGGIVMFNHINSKPVAKYPMLKQVDIYNDNRKTELEIDGITYKAPDGYSIEVINGNVHAIKRYYLMYEPKLIKDEEGNEIYNIVSGDVILDGIAYHEIIELAEPMIVNAKNI